MKFLSRLADAVVEVLLILTFAAWAGATVSCIFVGGIVSAQDGVMRGELAISPILIFGAISMFCFLVFVAYIGQEG